MSEEQLARGILIGHGAMAQGMVDAVRQITGIDEDALFPISNKGLSPDALSSAVRARVGAGPMYLFTDLQSGSCGVVARRLLQENPGLTLVSGVNLPVLLEFVMHRHMSAQELVPRLLAKGRAGIGCTPNTLESNVDRSPAR